MRHIPSWLRWCLLMIATAALAYSQGWTKLSLTPLVVLGIIGFARAFFAILMKVLSRNLASMTPRIILPLTFVLFIGLLSSGCDSRDSKVTVTVEQVRTEVAAILQKDAAQVDVTKPLGAQGADELDIVEIVMAVEEAFKVEIPDSAIGENIGDAGKTLTVQKLAEIVSKQQKTR